MAALHLTEAALRRERIAGVVPMDSAFFYVDGIPTKGCWIDLDDANTWEDIHLALQAEGFNHAGHGGDVLAADIDGDLARCFYSSPFDLFDLPRYVEVRDEIESDSLDRNAVAAFIDWRGGFDIDEFRDAYMGQYDSEEDFAWQLVDDCGMLADIPEPVARYFDMQAYARDLFLSDYYMDGAGYVFASY